MRITYLTTDEVNRELVAQVAVACDADFDVRSPRPGRAHAPTSAALYDLDHLEGGYRRAILADLFSGRSPGPAAVHSYDLQDDEVAALEARGILVSRRLEPDFVRQFCRLAGSRSPSTPDADGAVAEADEDDPAALGDLVRTLASSVHRMMPRAGDLTPAMRADETEEVVAQLHELQRRLDRLHGLSLDALKRWADNVQRLIEEHLTAVGCSRGTDATGRFGSREFAAP